VKKNEILMFTSISRVSLVTITKANKKRIIYFQFPVIFCHNSEENVKNMWYR